MTLAPATLDERSTARMQSWGTELAEFLLVGGATPVLFLFAWWLRRTLGFDEAEYVVGFSMFLAAHVINDPHFSVTYLLFYENFRARAFGDEFDRSQRARYRAAGLWAPALLVLWALGSLALGSAPALAGLIQLMFFLVGFHYVKQGFGVLIVLSARRGVLFSQRERTLLLAHALCAGLYAWASPYDPGKPAEEKGVHYLTLAHPPGLERAAQVVFFVTALALGASLLSKWRREGRLPLITPIMAFLCSTWLWSVYSTLDPLVRYAIPALHSLQYLYMVYLLKGNEAREREAAPWFEAPRTTRLIRLALTALALGWLLFRGARSLNETLASGPEQRDLGPVPYFAALYACVNLHHYFMDQVIWRKDNPHTRYLRNPSREAKAVHAWEDAHLSQDRG